MLRQGLARLALGESPQLAAQLLQHFDPALRCAAYSMSDLTTEQVAAAYQKDGTLFFHEAVHNQKLWRNRRRRQALLDAAWDIVKLDLIRI